MSADRRTGWNLWLLAGAIGVGLGILVLGLVVFEPLVHARAESAADDVKAELPAYDYEAWHGLPVQDGGRTKPFESACREAVRTITGSSRFEGHDPVAIVLMWMMLKGTSEGTRMTDWENYHFILCQDQDLRQAIYRDLVGPGEELTPEQVHGKYVSPEELRRSTTYKRLLDEADAIEQTDREKAQQLMSPSQRKAVEVSNRLGLFDRIAQNNVSSVGMPMRPIRRPSPFHFVAFDRVAGGGWFSMDELRECLDNPHLWQGIMKDRLGRAPQLYINPERREILTRFQEQIKAGAGQKPLDELADALRIDSDQRIDAFRARFKGVATTPVDRLLKDEILVGLSTEEIQRLGTWFKAQELDKVPVADLAEQMKEVFAARQKQVLEQLHARIPPGGKGYHPDDPRFRMLHLDYLENRFPDLYPSSAAWQKFPAEDATRALSDFADLQKTYRSKEASQFDQSAQRFFADLREISARVGPYPGSDTVNDRLHDLFTGSTLGSPSDELLALEMQFDRLMPFRWAWVLMLLGATLLAINLAAGSRFFYWAGWLSVLASLNFQAYGFFCRIILSGRPPVTDMYETVIWVAFMSSIFAVVLELIYRRSVILLAGALVATLGLVLADQLPLALDPKLNQLQPVLRSNYWLTIHVLTIVSSYAGGTLAWGLANLAIGMLAFGKPSRDTLKTLSQFTYRAMQIAVLLLAAGTFLGGWWAAESWGRFWGWDPKEVWALIALVCYVIPLHMRYIGWVKDFGLAVSAVLCYSAIVMSWYGVNFVLGAGLHSYGFGGGGPWWVFLAGLINVEWVLVASMVYLHRRSTQEIAPPVSPSGSPERQYATTSTP